MPVPFIVNNDGTLSRNAAEVFFASLTAAESEGNILAEMRTEAREAIPVLEHGLRGEDPDDVLFAARAIIEIDRANKSVKDVLAAALKSPQMRRRLIAAETLARSTFLKTNDALVVLLEILRDESVEISTYDTATIAIAHFGPAGKDALPLLVEHLGKWRKSTAAHFGVFVAGAIVKIDESNKEARAFLESHREALEVIARGKSDRVFKEFAKEILKDVRKKP